MTLEEFRTKLETVKEEHKRELPYMNNEEYNRLFMKYCVEGKDEFLFSELLNIYANCYDDNMKIRILSLIKDIDY